MNNLPTIHFEGIRDMLVSGRVSFGRKSGSRWWFQIFVIFTPKIGEDEPILTNIFFQRGWFNHQLDKYDFPRIHVCVFACLPFIIVYRCRYRIDGFYGFISCHSFFSLMNIVTFQTYLGSNHMFRLNQNQAGSMGVEFTPWLRQRTCIHRIRIPSISHHWPTSSWRRIGVERKRWWQQRTL